MVEEAKPIEEMSFREAMSELDSIVARLEANTMELEESLLQYERGVALLGNLQSRLNAAQQRVDVLMGVLEAAPDDNEIDTTLSKA